MITYWKDEPELSDRLESVLQRIQSVCRSADEQLNTSTDYLLATGGKMLRPALLITASDFGKGQDPEVRTRIETLAAAIETLHLATLVHDDIVDESDLRRGKATIQARYGKHYAVYMGDYLLCQTFILLAEHPYDPQLLKLISEGTARICLGEIRQYRSRFRKDLQQGDYLRIISGKTAALFALSLFAGAREAGAEEKLCRRLARIGYCAGIAFQITDDLMDYTGSRETLGKEVMTDLRQGYYTLPLILGLQSRCGPDLLKLLEADTPGEIQGTTLKQLLKSCGALEETQRMAEKYLRRAARYLEVLEPGDAREKLRAILDRLASRVTLGGAS